MEASPYSRQNVRAGIFHYLFGRGMSGLAGLASVVLLARSMDVQNYAGYTALTGLITMLSMFSGLGMERAVARYVPEGRILHSAKQLKGFIWKVSIFRLLAATTVTVALYALWPMVMQLLANSLHMDYFPWSLACFLLANVTFDHFSCVMQALVLQKTLTRILVIQWGGRLLLIGVLYYINGAIILDQAIWIMAIPETIGCIILFLVTRNYLINLTHTQILASDNGQSWPCWSRVMNMAFHNYGYNLLVSVPQGYFMRILAAALLPVSFVAAYGLFLSIIERIRQYLPVQLMYGMMEPILISRFIKNRDFTQLNYYINIMLDINMYCIISILSVFALFHEYIISLISHNNYTQYDWILIVLFFQLAWGTHSILLQLVSNSVGKGYLILFPAIASLVIVIIYLIVIIDISKEYIVVAPLLFSICNNILTVTALRISRYRYGVNNYKVIIYVLASMVFFHVVYFNDDVVFIISNYFHIYISDVVYKILISGSIIIVLFPIFVSSNNIRFLKDFLYAK
jgi:O-antigen/teichoic acid export membrane protein